MKSSFHNLIPFLPLFCNCQFRRLDSIQFLCSQAHTLAGWRFESRLTLLNWNLLYNNFARTTQKIQVLYCWEGMFKTPLHSSGTYSIVACLFVAKGKCLPSRCLAMTTWLQYCGFWTMCHNMERACSSKTSVSSYKITRFHNPEDHKRNNKSINRKRFITLSCSTF
jgi:hypothetical protein